MMDGSIMQIYYIENKRFSKVKIQKCICICMCVYVLAKCFTPFNFKFYMLTYIYLKI